ncbi:hypothetical protein VTK26DRAFT_5769 [Humicola hyalothermophila]
MAPYTSSQTSPEVEARWREYLQDAPPPAFPGRERQTTNGTAAPQTVAPGALLRRKLPLPRGLGSDIANGLVQVAWSLVNIYYSDADDIVYGLVAVDDEDDDGGSATSAAPAAVPFRFSLEPSQTISSCLDAVLQHDLARAPFNKISLQDLANLGPDVRNATQFDNQLILLDGAGSDSEVLLNCAINVECTLTRSRLTIQVIYDEAIVNRTYMQRVLATFEHVLQQLIESKTRGTASTTTLSDLNPISSEDLDQISKWNRDLPPAVDDCMYRWIERIVAERPTAEAVCAQALGLSFSYEKLNGMADKLAHHLVSKGVKPGRIVPFMFEKSPWVIPTMLAILKAGGAFVPLDPAHQWKDTQGLLAACEATFVVCSPMHHNRFRDHNVDAVVIESSLFDTLPSLGPVTAHKAQPSDPAYVIFTSGSTGTPKGIICSHSAWCTNTTAHGPREFHDADTRLLQFSAYTFDISITDIFTTLAFGGTVCVPTEHERMNDLAGAINRMSVNHVSITPTVAQFLHPDMVPTLKVMVTGGEAMPQELFDLWVDKIHLMNCYGPAECTSRVSCALKSPGDDPKVIGTNMGAALWVGRSNDPSRLVPVGAIGELLVEGNVLANGYLKNDEKTRESFIDAPEWLKKLYPQRATNRRLYRTGDLVRQNADGSLAFIGRRDTQIKVHGVRLEAGHIEAKIRQELPADAGIIVDKIMIGDKDKPKQTLAAFITLPDSASSSPEMQTGPVHLLPADSKMRKFVVNLRETLLAKLPSYMVPSHLLVINKIPLGATGKVNRRALQAFARDLAPERLSEFTGSRQSAVSSGGIIDGPQGDTEIALSKVWAQVLGIPQDSIGRQDGFFSLGGDSVSSMKLVAEAADAGLHFSVAEVFQYPSLAELAQFLDGSEEKPEAVSLEPIEPFELIGGLNKFLTLREQLRKSYKLAANRVEDVYPATPMQEGLMAETVTTPEAYILQEVLELSSEVDLDTLQSALETLVETHAILRTRIVRLKGLGTCQVVMDDDPDAVELVSDTDLRTFLAEDKKMHMGFGNALSRFAIVEEPNSDRRYLVWTVHHAVTDGHMHQLMLRELELAYNDEQLDTSKRTEFSQFVKCVTEPNAVAATLDFWKTQFSGVESTHFPPCPDMYEPSITDYIAHKVTFGQQSPSRLRFTPSILLRASWMIVLSHASNSNDSDFVMGITQSGRDISLPGVAECLGPCLATVPVRVKVDLTSSTSCGDYLEKVQQQYVDSIPHQHVGLQHIRKASDECAAAVEFRNLLVIQPPSANTSKLFVPNDEVRNAGDQLNFGLLLECMLSARGEVTIRAGFDSKLLSAKEATLLVHRLEHVYRQLSNASNLQLPLSKLDLVSPMDMRTLEGFNPDVPALEKCMHWMIEEQARRQPDALMVDSWDAQLTYKVANEYSDRLAGVLVDLGVGPETMVPFAFEKSAWATVAIHAILKAGGVCVALDMAHPRERHQTIVADTEARVIVASARYASSVNGLGSRAQPVRVVSVDRQMLDQLPPRPAHTKTSVSPSNAAWVVYSSGSTGVPKGSILEHRSLCSTSRTNSEILGVGPSTRAIHFASYSFDVAIEENVIIPMYGGCVCIPSDEDRLNDLPGVMRRMKINWADLTPTVGRMLTPENAPYLRTLVLGGEALTKDIIDTWGDKRGFKLFNTYGPSECSIQCTSSKPLRRVATGANIGRPVNCKLWVVDAEDPNRLLPAGSPGELLIEGPIVGRGYLNQPAKTKAAFVEGLAWAATPAGSTPRRFYRTGDLAKFNLDGTLDCLGRQDSQIKLHGQRIELGEIEYNIQKHLATPDTAQVAVEAFTPSGKSGSAGRKLLAAFIQFAAAPSSPTMVVMEMKEALRRDLLRIKSETAKTLPSYMVPSLFVPLVNMPMNTSGKIDRKKLREAAAKFDQKQLTTFSLAETEKDEGRANERSSSTPFSPAESVLAALWAETLGIDLEQDPIGSESSFLELGGDSITAMQLVGKARAAGLVLSVPRIMRAPKLKDMALAAGRVEGVQLQVPELPQAAAPKVLESPAQVVAATPSPVQPAPVFEETPRSDTVESSGPPTPLSSVATVADVQPTGQTTPLARDSLDSPYSAFQLVSGKMSKSAIIELLAANYRLDSNAIVDVYPATPLQEGMMALTSTHSDSYVLRDTYELPADVDVERFKAAWDSVMQNNHILRTRVAFIQGVGSCQVVVDEHITWHHADNIDDYLAKDRSDPMNYGTALARYAIIDDRKGKKTFVWTVHHALYDGYSIGLVFAAVDEAYKNNLAVFPTRPFVDFIRYLNRIDKETVNGFWTEQLKDVETSPFPQPPAGHSCQADNTISYSVPFSIDRSSGITMATLLKAAWAILISRVSESPDVVYGVTQSGRDLDLPDIEIVNGPTITTIPLRVKVEDQTSVRDFLKRLQSQTLDMIDFSHAGLQNIKKISDATRAACDFQNLLVIQPAEQEEESALFKKHTTATTANYLSGYGLVVECMLDKGEITCSAHHDSAVISAPQVQRLLEQLEHVLHQLQAYSVGTGRIQDVDMFSPADRADLVAWNSNYPKVVRECMHDIISRNAAATPTATAIASRAGDITYKELDELSNHLAHQLRDLGVVPDKLVPICLEKSPEAIIAMIAIQKAGGGFVPLNPADPKDRLLDLLEQVSATVVIFSEQTKHLQQTLIRDSMSAVVLPKTLAEWAPLKAEPVQSGATPNNLAYALFTSGSTGRPKAVMIEHITVSSSTYGHGVAMGFAEFPRRTVQFASYTFDACIAEIFTALHFGGCICVPTEHERMNNLPQFIRDFKCDWAFFTPSFVRLMKPEDMPTMKTVVLGGEALNQECIDVWGDKVHLMNGYGPTETCVFAVTRTVPGPQRLQQLDKIERRHKPETIGHPVSCIGWVVDPNNHNRLTPVGCVGELLIQGPSVARGYLGNPEKTAESFVQNPKWLRAFGHGGAATLYKTGDLVRQDVIDGTLTYLGRKDNQTKVNGQRLELGEIETQLKAKGTMVSSAVVLATGSDKTKQKLAAFVHFSDLTSSGTSMMKVDSAMLARLQALESAVRATLPRYMVPSYWIPITDMPTLAASGKTDRKTLAAMLKNLDATQLSMYALGLSDEEDLDPQAKQEAATDLEKTITELVASTLGLRPEDIGRNDSFFKLGGDSITAIQLVASARNAGLTLSTEAIFRQPRICDMATAAELAGGTRNLAMTTGTGSLAPYALIPKDKCEELLAMVERDYGVEKSSIVDLLPCTPLQEGLITLTVEDPEAYVLREIYRLPNKMDMNRFKAAWEAVVKDADVLRTRIVHLGEHGCFQLVINQPGIPWHRSNKVQEYIDYDKGQPFNYGAPLARFALIETEFTGCYFILSMHHAVYDGWSKQLIMKHVQEAYRGISPQPSVDKIPPYNRFIEYLQQTDPEDAKRFWKAQFDGLEAQAFPRPPSNTYKPILDGTQSIRIPFAKKTASSWTTATILKAAWAIVLARYTGAPDALFGVVQTGRNVPIKGISDMIGPTITTVPLRVRVDSDMTLAAFLEAIQNQSTDMMRYEHTGLQNIAKISSECREACGFSNIMVIQPGQVTQGVSDLDLVGAKLIENQDKGFLRFGMGLECTLEERSILLTGGYDKSLMSEAQMNRLLRQLKAAIVDISEQGDLDGNNLLVKDVNLVGAEDIAEMSAMNQTVPDDIWECTHEVIHRVALQYGDAMAVNAWDVDFQYTELDQLSSKLAHHLRSLGVGPETIVPLCFEKSGWSVVAILGVMKAGAAFVFLDPGYPMSRLNGIVQQVSAPVILASLGQAPLWRGSSVRVLIVDNVSIESLPSFTEEPNSGVTPSNALYVIFTSGSTGNPKGCVIEHHSFLTCARAQAQVSGMTASSRVLQGASYSFDVSVMEILTALTVGACICVPNDSIKKRSVVDVINDFRITWAFLTPSLVKFIKPSDIPHLKTLILGGEALTPQNIQTWAGHLRLYNGYGPSECTIAASAHPITSPNEDPSNIGKALGGICWIVDPDDYNKLTPLGAIGELIVEGSIVARGYLNNPEKTAEVFFENPVWAKPVDPSKPRRMYRTGDLAYFSTDGDIMFVGRKDAQVKVRGQRMELGEIETHLTLNKKIQHAMVLYPKQGPCKKQLVGIVSFTRFGATTNSNGDVVLIDPELTADVSTEVADMARELAALVPSYMIPEVWVVVHSFPLLLSGKLNRKRVEQWLHTMDKATHQRICGMGESFRVQPPSTEGEALIHSVWVEVLKLPAEEIGVTQEFSTLGGDSILAMLVVAKLKAKGLRVTMTDVVSARTIAQLASRVARTGGGDNAILPAAGEPVAAEEVTNQVFDLTPIQQFYANFTLRNDYLSKQTNKRFNHMFCLTVRRTPLAADTVRGAIEALVNRHGMLRARFQRDETAACGWRQYISTDAAGSYRFCTWDGVTVEQIRPALEQARQGLDIENGPLISADFVNVSDHEQYLMIVAHHLVVDLVSWNTILGDMQDYLQTGTFTSEKPYPFSAWAKVQKQYAIENFPPEKVLPMPVPPANYEYWDMSQRINILRDTTSHTIVLSERDTNTLLTTCNKAYGAEPMDMLCSGLTHSFSYVFRDRAPPTMIRYGHGREPIGQADPSTGTVGWFTTLSPIHVTVRRRDDSLSVLQRTIAARKSLVMNGLGFFASRYYHPNGARAFSALDKMEVMINYLGNSDNQVSGGGGKSKGGAEDEPSPAFFDMSKAIENGLGAEGQEVKGFALFSISAQVTEGRMYIQCVWNKKMRKQGLIQRWFFEYENALKDIAHQARKRGQQRHQQQQQQQQQQLLDPRAALRH